MSDQAAPPTDRGKPAIPLAAKVLLGLWMALVMGVFVLLAAPPGLLARCETPDLRAWSEVVRGWVQPDFDDLVIQY